MGTLVDKGSNNYFPYTFPDTLFSLYLEKSKYITLYKTLTLPAPIPDEEKRFIKPFEAPQRNVKIKI